MSLNKILLIGNVGQDPELRYTDSGTACCNVSLATTEYWKDASGEKKERTDWHSLVFWGKNAETAGEYIKKGIKLFIEGTIQYRTWEDHEGNKKYKTDIKVLNFQFLSPRKEEPDRPSDRTSTAPPATGGSEDSGDSDLPF